MGKKRPTIYIYILKNGSSIRSLDMTGVDGIMRAREIPLMQGISTTLSMRKRSGWR